MSDLSGFNELIAQVKEVSENVKNGDHAFGKRLDGLEQTRSARAQEP